MNNRGSVTLSTPTAILITIICIGLIYFSVTQHNKADQYVKTMRIYHDSVVVPTLALNDTLKKKAAAAKFSADSASAVAQSRNTEINRLSTTVVALHKQNKTLIDAALADTTLPESGRIAILGLTQEVDSLNTLVGTLKDKIQDQEVALANLNVAYADQKTRADTLEQIVIHIPKAPEPSKILGVTLPRIPSAVKDVALLTAGVWMGTKIKSN